MGGYLAKRSVYSAISLVVLVVSVFFFARLTGDPASLYLPVDVSAEVRARFIEVNGLADPVLVQFGRFIVGLFHLDLGNSMRDGRPAWTIAIDAFPITAMLAIFSMLIALVIAIITGALAAWRPNGLFDRLATIISLAGASIPTFWLAIVGVLVFAVRLRWLPTSGIGSPVQWILPISVLFVRPCGLIVQVVRGSMISALSSEYVKTAQAKGVSSRGVIFVHALRNAMLPVITVAGDQLAHFINGAVVVEVIFAFPGIGKTLIDAIDNRDFAVLQSCVLVTAVAIFLLNVAIDIAYALLDPRVRYN